jgi:cyclohexanecarboxylate-CoA ligase
LRAKVVFMDEWNPDIAVKVMDTEGCTWAGGATPFLMGILRSPSLSEHDIRSLRVFGCGGAGIPPALIKDFASRFPACRTGRGYGSTEYPTVSINYFDSPLDKKQTGSPLKGPRSRLLMKTTEKSRPEERERLL